MENNRELKENQETDVKAKIGDFANNAEKMQDNDFMMVEMAQGHTDALENVATVIYSDRAAFIHLFFTNATLTAQILKLFKKARKNSSRSSNIAN